MTGLDFAINLDRAADKISSAEDYYSRQCAIDEFKMICRDEAPVLNWALEVAKRGVLLTNPIQVGVAW